MNHPTIDNAPGLVWRRRRNGWEARWRARADLVKRGYPYKNCRLWAGTGEPTDIERDYITDRCRALQDEMLNWGRGGIPSISVFDGTLNSLIACYQQDPDSGYKAKRYKTRVNYGWMMRALAKHGDEQVRNIKARTILRWHEEWSEGGKVAMGHSVVAVLRMLMSFGATILEDSECRRVREFLRDMRFKMAAPRTDLLTADHAKAIRSKAHEMGLHSIALAQAIQFDLMFRQKDVIGEWIPTSEPGMSDVVYGNDKWMTGLRWTEIEGMILRHVTSKRQKLVEVDLRLAPMVMEEIPEAMPATGPVIVYERTGKPYIDHQWRREWRRVARAAGVPDHVYNMDSRAGAISEATDAGAELEHVRHAATHSNIAMTQRYSRGSVEKTAKVMEIRARHRNKGETR
jgi:hypothetical protein